MIPIGKASEPGQPDEPGQPGQPGGTQSPARQRSACRQVAVIVDGSVESLPALRQAAAQARQRNATLDVICLVPPEADARTVTMARVRLGELSRRACPYGAGAPVRLRVEHGDLVTVLAAIRVEVELLVPGPGVLPDHDQDQDQDQAGTGTAAAAQLARLQTARLQTARLQTARLQTARPQTPAPRPRAAARRGARRARGSWLHTLLQAIS